METNAAGDIWIIGVSGTNDWRTVHYHADGSFQWVATYADIGGGMDLANGLALDTLDYAYVTGTGLGLGGNSDIVTIKYSPSGTETWRRRYDGILNLADVDSSGNIYLSGTIFTSGSTSKNGTVKFNSSGDTLWARYWGPPLTVSDIVVEPDGDLYLTGEGVPPGAIFSDWGMLKCMANGDSAWFRWLLDGLFPVGFQMPRALASVLMAACSRAESRAPGPAARIMWASRSSTQF